MPSKGERHEASFGEDAAPMEPHAPPPPTPVAPKVWRSDELFGAEVEVFIAHEDQLYRLRRTRNGKLILCK